MAESFVKTLHIIVIITANGAEGITTTTTTKKTNLLNIENSILRTQVGGRDWGSATQKQACKNVAYMINTWQCHTVSPTVLNKSMESFHRVTIIRLGARFFSSLMVWLTNKIFYTSTHPIWREMKEKVNLIECLHAPIFSDWSVSTLLKIFIIAISCIFFCIWFLLFKKTSW